MRGTLVRGLYLAMASVIVLALWLFGWPAWQEYRFLQQEYRFLQRAVDAAKGDPQYEFNRRMRDMYQQRGTATTISLLRTLMHNPDEGVRRKSVGALHVLSYESEEAVVVLIESRHDPSPSICKQVKSDLCDIGEPAVRPLADCLATGNSSDWVFAANILGNIGAAAASALPELIDGCQTDDPLVRETALWALIQIDVDLHPMLSILIESLGDKNPEARRHARHAIAQIGARAVRELLKVRAFSSDDIAEEASLALDLMGVEAADGAIEVIDDADPIMRGAAAEILGHHMSTHTYALTCLLRLMRDDDEGVRIQAASTFVDLDSIPHEPITTLRDIAQDRNSPSRALSIRTLGRFGVMAAEAIPTLEQALDDADSDIREIAAKSIRQINDADHR
jgi:HEAT repeat protein